MTKHINSTGKFFVDAKENYYLLVYSEDNGKYDFVNLETGLSTGGWTREPDGLAKDMGFSRFDKGQLIVNIG